MWEVLELLAGTFNKETTPMDVVVIGIKLHFRPDVPYRPMPGTSP